MDDATGAQVAELLTKGAAGGWIGFTCTDARAEHERLAAAGVDITDEPSEKPYGIDFGIRDPFGNKLRIGQIHGV